MPKQILAISALIVMGAVSIQSAGAAEVSKLRQLVVEAAGTPAAAATKTGVSPFIVKPSQGIPAATDTAGAGAPAIADPQLHPIDPGRPAPETDKAAAIASDQPAAAAAPAVGPGRIASGIQSQKGLYLLLTGRGYGVEIVKRTADGNVLFSVTVPGHPGEAYLLLVDEYGKVIERRHVTTAYGYGQAYADAPTYAPRYAPTYAASDDNCDTTAGY